MTVPPVEEIPLTLLVDDSLEYMMLLERMLRRAKLPGDIVTLHSGELAVEYLSNQTRRKPDLVLMDWVMPGKSGEEVLAWTRSQERLADVPVMILSGSSFPKDRERALELGACDFVVKANGPEASSVMCQKLARWHQVRAEEKMLRSFCVPEALDLSMPASSLVGSSAAMAMQTSSGPLTADTPLNQIQLAMRELFAYMAAGGKIATTGVFGDRKSMEITRACREVGIEERDARGRCQDPVIARKRGRVIRHLMGLEWADTELLRHFQLSKRTLVDLRREYVQEQRKNCVVLAPGGR